MINATTASQLSLEAEELESLDPLAWNWGDFAAGVGIGLALVGLAVT